MSSRRLVGYKNFVRSNPKTDRFVFLKRLLKSNIVFDIRFAIHKFHHIEFWCSDAISTAKMFMHALGLNLVAKSDLTTGNKKYASYALQSNELIFIFSAPYSLHLSGESSTEPHPVFNHSQVHKFIVDHGLAVRAVTIKVDDAGNVCSMFSFAKIILELCYINRGSVYKMRRKWGIWSIKPNSSGRCK